MKIKHFHCLLADDEALLRQSVIRRLSETDDRFHVVKECAEGKSALEALKKGGIQVVFTDIRMPEMDGLELAKEIHEHYPEIVTVILTGYADFEYAQEAIRQGVFDYLLKPVNVQDLERVLGRILLHFQKDYEFEEDDLSKRSAEEVVMCVEKYLKNHFREEIDFGALSEELGYSSAYVSRTFTRFRGESPVRYLTSLRMKEAKKLLAMTEESVARVGELVGYPDQFYFSRTFRKETGENPTEYRKRVK